MRIFQSWGTKQAQAAMAAAGPGDAPPSVETVAVDPSKAPLQGADSTTDSAYTPPEMDPVEMEVKPTGEVLDV
jgi:hypothetical protein